MSPNQALIGCETRLLPDLIIQSQNLAVEERVSALREQREWAILALNQAVNALPPPQSRYKLGDQVWLEAQNLKSQYQSSKLAPKRHGPFQVIKEVSPVAYQLRLPASWRIHDVFHVSLLSPYRKTTTHGPNFTRPLPDLIGREEEYEVQAILNYRHHGRSRMLQYLIKWKGYPHSNNTWEPADQVHASDLTKSYHYQHPEMQDKRTRVRATVSAPPPNWLHYLLPSSIRALSARATTQSSLPAPQPIAPRPTLTPWNTYTSVANPTAPSTVNTTMPCPITTRQATPISIMF
jgi:hypothetical protein